MMSKHISIVALILFLSGCTTFHGLEPVSPKYFQVTDQKSPHFKWKPAGKEGVKYDFVIYEWKWKGRTAVPGKIVYSKNGLELPEHQIDINLEEGKKYLWTIRTREGDKVGKWSVYDYSAYYVFGYVNKWNYLYQLEIRSSKKETSPLL